MIVIGLTGSIGMGKSRVASMLRWLGVPTHDSDKAVHDALQPDGSGFAQVASMFPSVVENGMIDRKKLGAIVFNDPAALKQLESVLHPAAVRSQEIFIQAQKEKGKKAVVLEIPLLFETGADQRVNYTICVSAPYDVQKARVMKRPNMSEEKFNKILSSQMPDEQKRQRSDFVVDTGSGYLKTFCEVRKVLKTIGV